MLRRSSLVLLALVAACGGRVTGNGAATRASLDGAPLAAGTYANASPGFAGDLVTLQLLADGRFLRVRCLDDACTLQLPEDGHFVVSGANVSFYLGAGNVTGAYTPPASSLLDTWSFQLASGVLTLGRSDGASSSLSAVADADLCRSSSGSWSGSACDCGAGYAFFAGEGGCLAAPTPDENLCDSTGGSWADDDNILLGTYCECPRNQMWQDGSGCTALN